MIKKYRIKIPCSCCGKIVEKDFKTYCSGACKTKAYRDKETVTEEFAPDFEETTPIRKQKPKMGSPDGIFVKTGTPPPALAPILEKMQIIQDHKMEVPEFTSTPTTNFKITEESGICPHGAMVWKERGLCKYGCTLKGSSTKGKKGKHAESTKAESTKKEGE